VEGSFGAGLREWRMAAGLSLSGLSAQVNYSKSQLSKIENGIRSPTVELARCCDAVLGAQGKLAGLMRGTTSQNSRFEPAAGSGDAEHWTLELPPRGVGAMTWRERAGDTPAAAMQFSVLDLSMLEAPVPDCEDLDTMFRSVRQLGQSASPGVVFPLAVALLHAIRVQSAISSGTDRRRLLLASRVAVFIGWMAQEAGDDQAAVRWTDMGAKLATMVGDASVADYARVRKALIALYRGDAGRAVCLAAAARSSLVADLRVRRLAALREAQGHALAGDNLNCLAALEAARELAGRPEADSGDMALGSSAVPDMTELVAGWCLYDLGLLDEADTTLGRGLSRIPAGAYRTRARFATRQALVQASRRELEQACDTMGRVIPEIMRADSATIRTDLCGFSRQIGRWRNHPAVRQLQPTITAVLVGSPQTAARD
jgi:Helix-turn-helix domain